jgi:flagellar protein FlbD
MIRVTKLSGEVFALNSDLIVNIEETPDTVIALTTGQVFHVRESLEEVCRRVIGFKREIHSAPIRTRLRMVEAAQEENDAES